MVLLGIEPKNEKSKIKFIHLNHTNQLLDSLSYESNNLLKNGFGIAKFKEIIWL